MAHYSIHFLHPVKFTWWGDWSWVDFLCYFHSFLTWHHHFGHKVWITIRSRYLMTKDLDDLTLCIC